MSTSMIEPGARLAGRYRLDELVSESEGAAFWKATDETLARLVAVWTFAEGFPRTAEAVRAARATSRIADSRVTQVFDADDSGATPYVVEEWVVGQSLTDLLRQGPLEPDRAAGLVAEAAETLATANATGLFHLNLTPDKLIWSVGGAVKLTGIGVDAALRGISTEQPARADAQGLGRLLYAALTGYWPGPPGVDLPPAPLVDGSPRRPTLVRPGIPPRYDELVGRSAFQAPVGPGPVGSAREVAEALADVPRLVPIPVSPAHAPAAPPPERGTSRDSGQFPSSPSRQHSGGSGGRGHGRRAAAAEPPAGRRDERSRVLPRALMGVAALVVFVGVVVGAWHVGSSMSGSGTEGTETGGSQQASGDDPAEEARLEALAPDGADVYDESGDGDHADKAGLTIDGDASTAWKTSTYQGPDFGRLKPGIGIVLDMGGSVEVHRADLNLGGGGHDVEILVGDSAERDSMTVAGKASGATGETSIELDDPAEGRYVLVWFTDIPQVDGGWRGSINEVELHGKT
ncbi:protein kinase family protein [Nocardiopsis potens]|uniref:protein kinase family protein n=1 Tax=Nocardiopsis potens TaxID=1246458 RepID=UPI0004768F6A|nr:protein kinase family protein [Nocardiopsis potens]